MKYAPIIVFVLENGSYVGITNDEHENRKLTVIGYADKFFVPLHGYLMEVSEEFYVDFYKTARRQKYIAECAAANGSFSYDSLSTDEFNGENILIDYEQDVSENVIEKMLREQLYRSLDKLKDKERTVVLEHYFLNMTQDEIAAKYGVDQSTVSRWLT